MGWGWGWGGRGVCLQGLQEMLRVGQFFFTLAPRQEVGERNTSGDGDAGQGGSGRRHTAPAQNVWGGTGGGCRGWRWGWG